MSCLCRKASEVVGIYPIPHHCSSLLIIGPHEAVLPIAMMRHVPMLGKWLRYSTGSHTAELLKLTPRQVLHLAKSGQLPAVYLPGGAVRFDWQTLAIGCSRTSGQSQRGRCDDSPARPADPRFPMKPW